MRNGIERMVGTIGRFGGGADEKDESGSSWWGRGGHLGHDGKGDDERT